MVIQALSPYDRPRGTKTALTQNSKRRRAEGVISGDSSRGFGFGPVGLVNTSLTERPQRAGARLCSLHPCAQ